MRNSNQIIPDFTEDFVGFMIQSMLTTISFPREPFALVPLSKDEERIYGADATIESVRPLYIQFKRSLAYPDYSTAKFILERRKLDANCSPRTLYFDLRAKKPEHNDFQHNILFELNTKLERDNRGMAFYTAPLFLNRTAYLFAVHWSSILSWRPWNRFRRIPFLEQNQSILTRDGSIRFQNIPLLREHIVIPPHTRVDTHKHRYSYLESGKEICFHSLTILEESENLGQVIYDFIDFKDGHPSARMTNLKESLGLLGFLQENKEFRNQFNENNQIIDRWLDFGKMLWKEFEIYQFLLMKLKN